MKVICPACIANCKLLCCCEILIAHRAMVHISYCLVPDSAPQFHDIRAAELAAVRFINRVKAAVACLTEVKKIIAALAEFMKIIQAPNEGCPLT